MSAANTDKDIGDFFDRCADKRLMYEFEPEEQEKLKWFFVNWNIRPGQRVLEPGCGSGRLTQLLAETVGPKGEVYACDLSTAMIRLARERRLPPYVHFVEMSTLSIERSDGWFDAVICLNVFPHIMDKSAALTEFARVLKPAGAIWINHFQGREGINRFHHDAAPEVSNHTLPCPHTMRRLLEEGGFELLEVTDNSDAYSLRARRKD